MSFDETDLVKISL